MKNLFIVFVMLAALNANAQWVKVQSITNGQVYKVLNSNGDILIGADKVYKSTDSGQSWTVYYSSATYGINALNLVNGNIWISNNYQNCYTTNNGLNWVTTNLVKYIYDFTSNNGRIFAGTESWRCYYTDNGGANWGQFSDIWEDVMCFEMAGNNLIAGTSQAIYYTTNNGTNWILSDPGYLGTHDIITKGTTSFAATNLGIWSSTNNGVNWVQTSFGNNAVQSLESFNQNIFAGAFNNNGFYASTNNGVNWIQRNEGIGNVTINSLAIVGSTIFAATDGTGLWKRPLSEIVGIQNISTKTPSTYSLGQNYPNPFNSMCNVQFSMYNAGNVKLVVYDVQGREVQTLVNERLQPGTYEATFDGSMLNSGVYYYKLMTGNFTETKKMVLIK